MIKNLIEQAREALGSRSAHSNFRFVGQYGWACPQLGIDDYIWGRNRVVNQGLNHLLNAGLRGADIVSAWFVVPFAADVTPGATVTAANFDSTLTEFINYTQGTRPAWTPDGAATAQLLENAASPALFSVDTGIQTSIYGAGLVSVSTKGSTSGQLFSAAKAPTPFLSLGVGFDVKIKYRVTGTSS